MRKRLRLAALVSVGALAVGAGGCSSSNSDDSASSGPPTSSANASGSSEPALSLVVIGDSIPYNSPDDCPGCTGFVDRYAKALAQATGRKVETSNLSEHTGLTLPQLMDELNLFKEPLTGADAIIVGIAHNSFELNNDEQCGTTFDEATSTLKDWSKVTRRCAASSAAEYRPQYDELYATIAAWRAGRPTLLRTIDKYNDWNGWEAAHLTLDQERRTFFMHDSWNEMLCRSAEQHGFACADIYHAFNGPDGARPSGDLLSADYTHPSDEGNARIAHVLIGQGFDPLA
jgi:lysophospholipase L1-like esterase